MAMPSTVTAPCITADIACRRLAELSRSVTRHHRRVWQARCPTGQTRQLSPGPRDAPQRYDAVIGTRPPNAPGRARLPLVTRFLPAPLLSRLLLSQLDVRRPAARASAAAAIASAASR